MTTTITDTLITTPALSLTASVAAAEVLASPAGGAGAPAFLSLAWQHVYGASNVQYGYPPLDGSMLIQIGNLPVVPISKGGTGATTATGAVANLGLTSATVFVGTWNASTNSPTFASGTPPASYTGPGAPMYKVSVAGTTTLDGTSSWAVGDELYFSTVTNTWNKIDGQSSQVLSVAGRTGAVTLSYGDISGVAALSVAQTFTATQSATIQTPTFSSTMALNLTTGNDASFTATSNFTLANPSAMTPGTTGSFEITQDSTGGRTITSFGSYWKFGAPGAPVLSTAPNAIDTLFYRVSSSTRIVLTCLNGTQV